MSQEIRTSQGISDFSSKPIPLEPQSVNACADQLMDELFSDIDHILGTSRRISDSSSEPIPLEPQSVNACADQLMDELFSDIDHILDGGSKLPKEPAQQPDNTPHVSSASREQNTDAPEKTRSDTQVFGFGNWFDKFWLGVTFTSLVGIVILLLASKYGPNWSFWSKPIYFPTSQNTQNSKEDAEFINYMQRSLEVMDRKAQASKQQAMISGLQLAPNQSLVLVPSNLGQGSNPGQMSLEKVYIPVYPQPQSPYPPAASVPESPQRLAVTLVPLPKLQGPAEPQSTAPATQHRLVRVFVGDRSAALFEVNGVTQRIHLGENIGTSGWTLVSVINQEATIRRNTEVRAINIGEKF